MKFKIRAIWQCFLEGHIPTTTVKRRYCLRCGRRLAADYRHLPSKRKQGATQWQQ